MCSGLFFFLCLSLVLTFTLACLFVVNLGEQGNKAEIAGYSFIQWAACIFGILTNSGIRIPGYHQATHNLAETHLATYSSAAAAARLRKAKTATTPNNRAAKRPSRPPRLITRTATTVGKHEASHSYSLVDSIWCRQSRDYNFRGVCQERINITTITDLEYF